MAGEAQLPDVVEQKLPDPFEVVSIRAVPAPAGTSGANWHRYEISQGKNRIVGYRAGAADSVREEVELIVVGLNTRRTTRRGRVHVILNSGANRRLQ